MSLRDFSSDELLIGKIKALTSETEIKTLLDAYQHDKSLEQNVDLLGGSRTILQKHLAGAVKLLQSMDSDYPALAERISSLKGGNNLTKVIAATAIVKFIHDARAIRCLKCKEDFTPYSAENTKREVTCFRCKRPGHLGCYADTQVDEEIGVVFLCSECLSSRSHPSSQQTEQKPPETAQTDVISNSAISEKSKEPAEPASASEETPGNDLKSKEIKTPKDEDYDRTRPVCPLLLRQECPHGITGLTDGECQHYHPTWCKRYMRNGPEGTNGGRGCKRGDSCRYFHTQLCQNGLVAKMCLNKECKLMHIRGVQRISSDKPPSKPAATGKKGSGPPVQDDPKRSRKKSESTLKPNHGKNASKSFSNKDFLQHLDQMKSDWTKEVTKEMSAMIQKSFQAMMVSHLPPQASSNPQIYLPPGVQYSAVVQQPTQRAYHQAPHLLQGYPAQQLQQPVLYQPLQGK